MGVFSFSSSQLKSFANIFMNGLKNIIRVALVGVLLVLWMNGANAQGALSPVNLHCALRTNPLGIDDAAPRLSWQLQSNGQARGEVQSAYQIQAGSSAGAADLWDSGKVASSQALDIMYAGLPLVRGQKCFWQVRVFEWTTNVYICNRPA